MKTLLGLQRAFKQAQGLLRPHTKHKTAFFLIRGPRSRLYVMAQRAGQKALDLLQMIPWDSQLTTAQIHSEKQVNPNHYKKAEKSLPSSLLQPDIHIYLFYSSHLWKAH